jgi:hypothetical protein
MRFNVIEWALSHRSLFFLIFLLELASQLNVVLRIRGLLASSEKEKRKVRADRSKALRMLRAIVSGMRT